MLHIYIFIDIADSFITAWRVRMCLLSEPLGVICPPRARFTPPPQALERAGGAAALRPR